MHPPENPRESSVLRLVTDEPESLHPLTTRATPLLPSREAAGRGADVWEEVDRAAAWVSDRWAEPSGGVTAGDAARKAQEARHALRVLCVALRGAVKRGAPWCRPSCPGRCR
jgi:hypothetical protein